MITSAIVYGIELIKRTARPLEFAFHRTEDAVRFFQDAPNWAWGEVLPAQAALATYQPGNPSDLPRYSTIVWVEPETDRLNFVPFQARRLALPGAYFQVIATTGLRRFLPAWRRQPRPAQSPASPLMVIKAVKAAGWSVTELIGYHSPKAVLWSLAGRLAERVHRPDWADRTNFMQRTHYIEHGKLWWSCPLVWIQACLKDS